MTERYAVYFAPADDSELGIFGQTVLCRSAIFARVANAKSTFQDQARWLKITEKPAHYGFHATLKAPFELKPSHNMKGLIEAVDHLAKSHQPIELESLTPNNLDGFMALTLGSQIDQLSHLALDCVESFEPFRKPISAEDLQRRRLHGLTNRQDALMLQYGYPYVADEFRFHLTLSSKLSEHDKSYERWITQQYKNLVGKTPALDRISVFTQANRQASFIQLASFALSA